MRVWFQHFPLRTAELERDRTYYQVKGRPSLAGQEDESHRFLYGHRYWGAVKKAVGQARPGADPEATIRDTARASGAPMGFAPGMAAIAWMTVRQAGRGFLDRDAVWTGKNESPADFAKRRTQTGGPIARLFDRTPRIFFHKSGVEDCFPVIPGQEMTTAAERDKRPWHQADDRCYEGMGPIPVDCRSGSCGTCWIGVIAGNENLGQLTDFERRRMEYFGYRDSGFDEDRDGRPLIRLACQTVVKGTAAVVIAPWNGVFGKARRDRGKNEAS